MPSPDVKLIEWIVEHSNANEKQATAFVRREMEENGDDCWRWQAVYIVNGEPSTCHVYDASDWRERGYEVYEV
jgi:hypothetical protein